MRVTEYNVGHWCLSEDECIAQGIDFAAYERGVADAAKAFGSTGVAGVVSFADSLRRFPQETTADERTSPGRTY